MKLKIILLSCFIIFNTVSILVKCFAQNACNGLTVITDTRDGQTYKIVAIGNQCWMSQNLNIGTNIFGVLNQYNNGIIEKYCYYDNSSFCNTYGGLYQWAETVQYYNGGSDTSSWTSPPAGNLQGICPSGWHLPTNAEWTILVNTLGGDNVAGGPMKDTGTVYWNNPNTGATNSSGFSAISGGDRAVNGLFYDLGTDLYLRSVDEGDFPNISSYIIFLNNTGTQASSYSTNPKAMGCSVRCIKDDITTGYNYLKSEIDFAIFPNPSKGIFRIEKYEHNYIIDNIKIQIFNSIGKIVINDVWKNIKGNNLKCYNISDMSKGIYYVKIITKNNYSVKKIIIQ